MYMFKETLKLARKKLQMSQSSLSQSLQIPLRTWETWEGGQRIPAKWVQLLITEKLERMVQMKFYTLKRSISASGNEYHYKAFDESLREMDAKHLNPKIVNDLNLIEIFQPESISLEFYEDNIFVGEIANKKYYKKGNKIEGAAVDAARKMFGK